MPDEDWGTAKAAVLYRYKKRPHWWQWIKRRKEFGPVYLVPADWVTAIASKEPMEILWHGPPYGVYLFGGEDDS